LQPEIKISNQDEKILFFFAARYYFLQPDQTTDRASAASTGTGR
jgi:hypothetical protein